MAASKPGFRTEFARRFIEPNYKQVDINVVKVWNLFAEFSRKKSTASLRSRALAEIPPNPSTRILPIHNTPSFSSAWTSPRTRT